MLTAKETQAAQAFWTWFEQNRLPFEFIFDMSDEQRTEIFKNLEEKVSAFAEGLDVQPGTNFSKDGPKFRVVVSASGQIPLFKKAKALAALAPAMPDWLVCALVPPLKKGISIRFNFKDGLLYPEDVWFRLMEAPAEPSFLGLHLALKQFDQCADEEAEQDLLQILMQLVLYVIGEESFAIDIQHLEIGPRPPDPFEEGFIELYDLPQHIAEFRKERPRPTGEMEG
jgi:hypothetical protein